ncbi:MAG: response regulator [Rhodocyclaceae bacterium]|jgi:signal transduction histidine kinase|nr:response regulator [Rhodocyclaceae bacterium]
MNPPSHSSVHRAHRPPPGATILVVDDSADNLTVLGTLLQPLYRVRAVNSGERALRAAHSEPRPDLILLDVMMPDMNGYEVMRQLRADAATVDIPVIFITAMQDERDELQGFELGAADYIHKPISGPIVLSRVRAQLDAKAARDMLKKHNERLVDQVETGSHALEQAQLALLQSEKLAAMGQLAAGVTHEINNPVGFVGANLSTLDSYVQDIFSLIDAYEQAAAAPEGPQRFAEVRRLRESIDLDFLRDDIRALLAESQEGIGRVRRIVQDMKDFSRVDNRDWQWHDLHQGIESTLNIARNEWKYHCTIERQFAAIPRIRCLASQLNQVFMNLVVNAAQAIEDKGVITITTASVDADTVSVSIADTGKGMSPEVLAHIFEPFYTTKPVGKGTGLGLSLAWEIVERHHGRIEAVSEPGRGTCFTIFLPINHAGEAEDVSPGR